MHEKPLLGRSQFSESKIQNLHHSVYFLYNKSLNAVVLHIPHLRKGESELKTAHREHRNVFIWWNIKNTRLIYHAKQVAEVEVWPKNQLMRGKGYRYQYLIVIQEVGDICWNHCKIRLKEVILFLIKHKLWWTLSYISMGVCIQMSSKRTRTLTSAKLWGSAFIAYLGKFVCFSLPDLTRWFSIRIIGVNLMLFYLNISS